MWKNIEYKKSQFDSCKLGILRNCPICNSDNSKCILEIENFQFYLDSEFEPKQFSIRENICLDCFAIYLNPVYSEYGFNVLFREAGQSYGVQESHVKNQITWLDDRNLLSEGFSVLDVGCYDGNFLSNLPEYIYKYGEDIDKPAIERAKKKFIGSQTEFFHGAFETFKFDGKSPDTIIMFHVLEHVANPVKVLEKLRNISKDTTNLVIEVPIIQKGKTNDINGFFSIQHTTHFSHQSLKNCLARSGWDIIEECSMEDYNGFRVRAIPASVNSNEKIYDLKDTTDWYLHLDYLSSWYESLSNVEATIGKINQQSKYVIWGGGAHTEFLFQTTSFFHQRNKCKFIIVDGDNLKHGSSWRGIDIFSPKVLNKLNWNDTALVISSYGSQNIIKKAAIEMGVPMQKIFDLYEKIIHY